MNVIHHFVAIRESFLRKIWGHGIRWCGKGAIRESFLRENHIFHQFAKVFSLESFPLYGIWCTCILSIILAIRLECRHLIGCSICMVALSQGSKLETKTINDDVITKTINDDVITKTINDDVITTNCIDGHGCLLMDQHCINVNGCVLLKGIFM